MTIVTYMHVPGLYTNCVLCRLSVCSIEPVPYNFVNDLSSSVQTSFLVHLKGTAMFYKRIYPYACFSFLQTINNHPVVTQESYQDLGIIISEDLFWKLHYELTTSRAYKILGLINENICWAQCTSISALCPNKCSPH